MEDLLLEILEELRNAQSGVAKCDDAGKPAAKRDQGSGTKPPGAARSIGMHNGDKEHGGGEETEGTLGTKRLLQIIRKHNEGRGGGGARPFAKKQLLPYYLHVKETDRTRWERWGIDSALERRLVRTLRMKPRRTASGVATITVLTKPWPCSGMCLYCPNDVRMPKSYLADEPACQRAERNWFDPYLQVSGRLHALAEMGHITDKVELIVLGGTWSDYPTSYQTWFMHELFRALNDEGEKREARAMARRALYRKLGMANTPEAAAAFVAREQRLVREGRLTYNQAVQRLYGPNAAWACAAQTQTATLEEVEAQHKLNETARRRCVGLVVETRPDAVTPEELVRLRQFGCTKVQMGIQSLDPRVLSRNCRATGTDDIERAFALLRLFGFKTHVHAMVNLCGSTAKRDMADYRRLVTQAPYLPDEVKLYPCVLVEGTGLDSFAESGAWKPYSENELVSVLAADVLATPAFTRISRMIRDISSHDIKAGNKKTNLRQMVEAHITAQGTPIEEIRHREIGAHTTDPAELALRAIPYRTTVSREFFLQWVTPENRIAGFLRLSLPDLGCVRERAGQLPVNPGEAMIREVHVYGRVASLHEQGQNAQHTGLGRKLVERACEIAQAEGYAAMNVISAVGTREYYRNLGFTATENALYLRKELAESQ